MMERVAHLLPKRPVGMSTAHRALALLDHAVDPSVVRRHWLPAETEVAPGR